MYHRITSVCKFSRQSKYISGRKASHAHFVCCRYKYWAFSNLTQFLFRLSTLANDVVKITGNSSGSSSLTAFPDFHIITVQMKSFFKFNVWNLTNHISFFVCWENRVRLLVDCYLAYCSCLQQQWSFPISRLSFFMVAQRLTSPVHPITSDTE